MVIKLKFRSLDLNNQTKMDTIKEFYGEFKEALKEALDEVSPSKYFQIDRRSLELYRIYACFWTFYDLIVRIDDFEAFHCDTGLFNNEDFTRHGLWFHRLLFRRGSCEYQSVLFLIHFLVTFCLFFGYYPRLMSFLHYVCTISLHERNHYFTDGGDKLYRHLSFWLALLPTQHYSFYYDYDDKKPKAIREEKVKIIEQENRNDKLKNDKQDIKQQHSAGLRQRKNVIQDSSASSKTNTSTNTNNETTMTQEKDNDNKKIVDPKGDRIVRFVFLFYCHYCIFFFPFFSFFFCRLSLFLAFGF